jgi:plasmid maintenance system antidote protein VapI
MYASPLDEKSWRKYISQVSGVSEKLLGEVTAGKKALSLQTAKKLISKMTTVDAELQHDATLMVVEVLRHRQETSPLDEKTWRKQASQTSGVSESLLKDLIEGKKDLSAQTAKKLVTYLLA